MSAHPHAPTQLLLLRAAFRGDGDPRRATADAADVHGRRLRPRWPTVACLPAGAVQLSHPPGASLHAPAHVTLTPPSVTRPQNAGLPRRLSAPPSHHSHHHTGASIPVAVRPPPLCLPPSSPMSNHSSPPPPSAPHPPASASATFAEATPTPAYAPLPLSASSSATGVAVAPSASHTSSFVPRRLHPLSMPAPAPAPLSPQASAAVSAATAAAAVLPPPEPRFPYDNEYSIFVGDLAPTLREEDLVAQFIHPPPWPPRHPLAIAAQQHRLPNGHVSCGPAPFLSTKGAKVCF